MENIDRLIETLQGVIAENRAIPVDYNDDNGAASGAKFNALQGVVTATLAVVAETLSQLVQLRREVDERLSSS